MSIVAIVSKYEKDSVKLAEYTASKLGYRLITMGDLIKATAEDYGIPEKDLSQVAGDSSLNFNLSRKKSTKQVVLLEKKLCDLLAEDDIIFCGLFGYALFCEISHALKVLVVAQQASERRAGAQVPLIKKLFKKNRIGNRFNNTGETHMEDPNLYDLALNLSHMDITEAGDIIIKTLKQKCFVPMTFSLNHINNMTLSCQVKTALIDKLADVEVKSHDKTVYVYSKTFRKWKQKTAQAIKDEIMRMPDVNYVEVYGDRSLFDNIREPVAAGV